MTRIDKLKTTSDTASCPATRTINKKCNKSKQEKQAKDRNSKEKKQKGESADWGRFDVALNASNFLFLERKNRQ